VLWRTCKIPPVSATDLTVSSVYRAELVRDRDAVGGNWLAVGNRADAAWVGPDRAGTLFQDHAQDVPVEFDRQAIVLGTIIAVLTIVIAVLVNRIHVYRLQRQIDELDRLRGVRN
jgi:hypothetical protein